jgi:hypothetical protein
MHDLLIALDLALKYTPDQVAPGLNVILFEFPGENQVDIFSTNGHAMFKASLEGLPVTGGSSGFYTNPVDIRAAIETLGDSTDMSLTVWGDDLMFIAGAKVATVHRVDGGFVGKQHEFFERKHPASMTTLDFDRIKEVVDSCGPIMAAYGSCGPAVTIKIKEAHWAEESHQKYGAAIVSPRIRPGLPCLASIDVVIMGLAL